MLFNFPFVDNGNGVNVLARAQLRVGVSSANFSTFEGTPAPCGESHSAPNQSGLTNVDIPDTGTSFTYNKSFNDNHTADIFVPECIDAVSTSGARMTLTSGSSRTATLNTSNRTHTVTYDICRAGALQISSLWGPTTRLVPAWPR